VIRLCKRFVVKRAEIQGLVTKWLVIKERRSHDFGCSSIFRPVIYLGACRNVPISLSIAQY
jgi:hypothetical protein